MEHQNGGTTPPVAKHIPREQAADAAFYAVKNGLGKDRPLTQEERDVLPHQVAQAVREALRTMPMLSWFPGCVQPGRNTDAGIRVSLNGRLIIAERGIERGQAGQPMTADERYGLNWEEFNNLLARLLDLVDATYTDPVQREAQKRIVKHAVKDWVSDIVTDAAADAGLKLMTTSPYVGGVLGNVEPGQIGDHAEAVAEQAVKG